MSTEVRLVKNYCFLNDDGIMVDITSKRRERHYLFGKYNDEWAKIMGTEYCKTSTVIDVSEEGKVVTQNSIYQLGTVSPDYNDFLEAIRKGIHYVAEWSIYECNGTYYLRAHSYPNKKLMVIAKIIAQNGNFLTIQRLTQESISKNVWREPETIFVCWNTMSTEMSTKLQKEERVAGIEYTEFQEFNGINCRPNLRI